MTNWTRDRLATLLDGTNGEVVAVFECPADGRAALFEIEGRLWFYETGPGSDWHQLAPEVVDDALGIGWGGEIGTDPTVLPVEDAPTDVGCLIECVREGRETHAHDSIREAFS